MTAQREMQADKDYLEREFGLIRRRLEAYDPKYRWENQLYQRIVQTLERRRVSVTQAFERFDEDHDGNLSRAEFIEALSRCGLSDLSAREVDLLIQSVDADGDGKVQYHEFARKLARCGLRTVSAAEMRVHTIIKALRRLNMKKSDLFRLINKEGQGLLTRQDFRDTLSRLEMPEVSPTDVENFIEYFYKDEKGGIDLPGFLRIFERYERQIDQEENPQVERQRRRTTRVPRQVLELKKAVYSQVQQVLTKAGASLRTFFQRMDRDGSQKIELAELQQAFRQMKLDSIVKEDQVRQIYASIDFDGSGAIEFAEF